MVHPIFIGKILAPLEKAGGITVEVILCKYSRQVRGEAVHETEEPSVVLWGTVKPPFLREVDAGGQLCKTTTLGTKFSACDGWELDHSG